MFKLEKFYSADFNPQTYWDDKYAREHVAGKSSDEFRQQDFWPLIQKYFAKGKRYLDAACGIGGWILFLREEGYQVEGIDTRPRTLRAMTEYDPDLKVKIASMTGIPHADSSLDGIVAIGALEYVENEVDKALSEAKRVLKPGGVLLAEVPHASTIRRWFYIPLKKLERWWKVRQGKTPTFANYLFNRAELVTFFENAGFTLEDLQPHELPQADSHYGLYVDWPFLRGSKPYQLNWLGRLLKTIFNTLSPWIASTGVIIVAKKK
jgi:SAM-dependent methyltransferase